MKGCFRCCLHFDVVILDDDPEFIESVRETLTHALEEGVGKADWIAIRPPILTAEAIKPEQTGL
uniref:hypothetical protein n=1 Tax=Hylemonella sp. TaxID=2066020 RepID=UPI0035B08695